MAYRNEKQFETQMKSLKEYLLEEKSIIPDKLYHATIRQRLNSIKKLGLGAKIPKNRLWDYKNTEYEDIKQGFFCDVDPVNAYDYISSSDEVWDNYEDFDEERDIIVFEIDTKDLDKDKLSIDSNNQNNEDNLTSYFYNGIISFDKLKKIDTKGF